MSEYIQKFIDAMTQAGMAPADASSIVADDKLKSYRLVGDKPRQKKGFYRLAEDTDFAYGYFGDWRVGEPRPWHAYADRKMTREERNDIEARMEARRIESERIERERQLDCAKEAQDFLLFLDNAITHPYLSKKGIGPNGSYISGDDLIIPMRDSAQVWSYQTIRPDGEKLFFGGKAGARARALWFKIPGDQIICVAEGFATGATIAECTGHTVYVTFNAGNMVACAKEIRVMHPDAKIVFCADNDHFKKDKNGIVIQTGIKKAMLAATAVDGYIAWPETHKLLKGEEKTDFNDLFLLVGAQDVKDRIDLYARKPTEIQADHLDGKPPVLVDVPGEAIAGGVSPHIPTPLPDSDWRTFLQVNKNGDIIQSSTTNLLLIMRNDERLEGVFKYNSFAKHIILNRCPPWENEQSFSVRSVADYDYIRLEAFLETAYRLKTGKNKCADAITSTAQLPVNTFNPAIDYFKSLQWDGVRRLDTWLKEYVSDGKQPAEYLSTVGRKFMCGLAARAMMPGVKFDTMIILEGKQNGGKSRLASVMSTIHGVEYFLDDFRDTDNKDSLLKIQGKLVVEFPEITTMRRTEVNELKGFLSRRTDIFRPPYDRNSIEAPRQCVFVGTVNPEGEYLKDVTGNRRYWPISCRDKLDLDNIRANMEQMHAEAAFLVKNGEQLWLNDHEYSLAEIEQSKRVQSDVWTDSIENFLRGQTFVTTDDVMSHLNIPLERRAAHECVRISKVMTLLGWESVRKRMQSGDKKRGWEKRKLVDAEIQELPL